MPGDFHPPLYYIILKLWTTVFGFSEVSLRIPSVIFAALTIYLIYKMFGKMAALFCATGPLFFYYAFEARMYMLAALLVTFSIYLFIKERWLLFSISLVLIGMTDYPALLILPAFWIVSGNNFKKLMVSHIPLVLAFVFWMPTFLKQISLGASAQGTAWAGILGELSIKNILLIPTKLMIGRVGFENDLVYALVVGLVSVIFGMLLFRAQKGNTLIWLWLLVPVSLAIIVSSQISILTYFRFLFVLPAFYILAAKGAEEWKKYGRLFFFLVLGVNLAFIGYYLVTPRFHRENWKGLANAISDTKVVYPAPTQKEALIYYGKGSQIIDFDKFQGGEEEIWLSRYVWNVFDPNDAARKKVESLGYNKTQEFNFNGVVFWKYENSN
jgi:4-amino-4-deoxy-L-arabinose transferase-like glycosyltransferase